MKRFDAPQAALAMTRSGPLIIPFFLPAGSCPFRCVYCNQGVSGGIDARGLTPEDVVRGIRSALRSPKNRPGARVEAGFFGGTFTLLPQDRQAALLSAVRPFLEDGSVHGIRISTRPDGLSGRRIRLLIDHGVDTVEIGAQSMDDRVLALSGRGHTARRIESSAGRVRDAGLRLGLQLMIGLPGEDPAGFEVGLDRVLALRPEEARIYPALVLSGSVLEQWYRAGRYQPLDLIGAVQPAARMFARLSAQGTRVIRIGLTETPDLAQGVVAGPRHPAFGELVKSEVFAGAIGNVLQRRTYVLWNENDAESVFVPAAQLSQALGQGKRKLEALRTKLGRPDLRFKPDPDLPSWHIRVFDEVFPVFAEYLEKEFRES